MIVNLTARVIRLYNTDRPDGVDDLDLGLRQTLDPKQPSVQLSPLPLMTIYQDEVPVELIEYGHAENLPSARDGVFYVVPLEVALAHHPRRTDLLVTHNDVRTSDGTVIGCRSLAQPT